MTEPMNEERARQTLGQQDWPWDGPTPEEFAEIQKAKGYLERVEQTKKVLEAADRMADAHKHPTRDYCVQCQLRDEYRAARAKIYPNPYRRRYIRPEPKPIRESVCIRCFKPFDSTAYNNLVNRVCQVCTKKLDKGEPGK
jgi:hypothetical protein